MDHRGAVLTDRLVKHSRWLRAAAIYNVTWGIISILFPKRLFRILGTPPPRPTATWQAVGVLVAAYAPAYWWASKDPIGRAPVVAAALLGKTLGPIGFIWALASGKLPRRFGLTIVTNDLIWWPAFAGILSDALDEFRLRPRTMPVVSTYLTTRYLR